MKLEMIILNSSESGKEVSCSVVCGLLCSVFVCVCVHARMWVCTRVIYWHGWHGVLSTNNVTEIQTLRMSRIMTIWHTVLGTEKNRACSSMSLSFVIFNIGGNINSQITYKSCTTCLSSTFIFVLLVHW